MSAYDTKPDCFLEKVHLSDDAEFQQLLCCAGFELQAWRCKQFANHLVEWLPEYALAEPELSVSHGNMYVRLQEAAVRVYTSDKYAKRGEAGEIALHAACREFFSTIPISPRVFYKSASNDVVKSFDMVHVRFPEGMPLELWLGESKLYLDGMDAIKAAIDSVELHLEQGFLTTQKFLLGPQIPRNAPRYNEIMELFKSQASLDKLLSAAVFVIGIAANSKGVSASKLIDDSYKKLVKVELDALAKKIVSSGLNAKVRVVLIYLPLGDKEKLVEDFDAKLKGLQ